MFTWKMPPRQYGLILDDKDPTFGCWISHAVSDFHAPASSSSRMKQRLPFALVAFDSHAAAVRLDNMFDDAQPDANPRGFAPQLGLAPIKALEDLAMLRGWNARAMVGNPKSSARGRGRARSRPSAGNGIPPVSARATPSVTTGAGGECLIALSIRLIRGLLNRPPIQDGFLQAGFGNGADRVELRERLLASAAFGRSSQRCLQSTTQRPSARIRMPCGLARSAQG